MDHTHRGDLLMPNLEFNQSKYEMYVMNLVDEIERLQQQHSGGYSYSKQLLQLLITGVVLIKTKSSTNFKRAEIILTKKMAEASLPIIVTICTDQCKIRIAGDWPDSFVNIGFDKFHPWINSDLKSRIELIINRGVK